MFFQTSIKKLHFLYGLGKMRVALRAVYDLQTIFAKKS
jgi:hypothetical protein